MKELEWGNHVPCNIQFWQAETEKHHIIIGQSGQYPDQDLTQFLPNVRTTSEVFEEQKKLQKQTNKQKHEWITH